MRAFEIFTDLARYDHGRSRIPIAACFGDDHDVRLYAVILDVEPFATAAKAGLSFVNDEESTDFVSGCMQLPQVLLRRENHSSCREHGFDDNGGNIFQL